MHLIAIIKSLSLTQGAVVVGALSAVAALATSRLESPPLRWAALLSTPFAFAYSLYWSPVWFGGNDATEYSAWMLICVVPWTLVGMFVSVIVAGLIRRMIPAKPQSDA